ncbi:hypothetical protein CYMTET_42779, partial [Cymbomonas tetramitiformis]
MKSDQIIVLSLDVDLVDTSVLTRIEWMADDDNAARPMQTISWLQNDALSVFKTTLGKYGTINSVNVDTESEKYSTLDISYHNFPLLATDFALVSDMSKVHKVIAEQALEGFEYTTVMVPTLIDGMAQLVPTMSNGKLTDPIDHPELHYTCANATLKYGVLAKYTYCFYTCATDPLCEWVEYDTITKACGGGEYVCGTQALQSTVNKKRLGIKLRTEVVQHQGKEISGATFLSATSHVYRPYTPSDRRRNLLQAVNGGTKGLSCLLESTALSIGMCIWSKVTGMEMISYQHPSTGTGNIYKVESFGMAPGSPQTYVCPGLHAMRAISVAEEGMSMKTASCASYLSNDIQSYFAVLVYDQTASPPSGQADCYLLSTCGSVDTPMVTYDTEFGSAMSTDLTVVIMAKEATILPMNVDSTTGPLTLVNAASAAGSTMYSDFLNRASAANAFVSNGKNCLTNHHGFYDSGQYATSSVCLPASCSIWGTSPGYREDIRFYEDTCDTNGACCADEDLVPTLKLCSQTSDPDAACVTKINGTAVAVDYDEI